MIDDMVVVWVVYLGRILLLREGRWEVVMLVAGGCYAEECLGVEGVIFDLATCCVCGWVVFSESQRGRNAFMLCRAAFTGL